MRHPLFSFATLATVSSSKYPTAKMANGRSYTTTFTEGYVRDITNQFGYPGARSSCADSSEGVEIQLKQNVTEKQLAKKPQNTQIRVEILVG